MCQKRSFLVIKLNKRCNNFQKSELKRKISLGIKRTMYILSKKCYMSRDIWRQKKVFQHWIIFFFTKLFNLFKNSTITLRKKFKKTFFLILMSYFRFTMSKKPIFNIKFIHILVKLQFKLVPNWCQNHLFI